MPEGPLCATCNPRDVLTCSSCGRTAVPCTVSKVTGQPRCGACARSRARCSRCGQLAPARAGTRDALLCGDCAVPDPGFFKTCPACGSPGRLIAGACRRCHLRQRLDKLLADGTGNVRPELQVLHQTLTTTDRPAAVLTWLSSATSQTMRRSIESGSSTRDTPHPAHSARRGRTRPIPPPSPTRSRSTPNPHRASRPPHPGPRHRSTPDPSCASTTATT